MNTLKAHFSFLLSFLIIDAIWIAVFVLETYQQQIGHLMATEPRLAVTCVFYLGYTAAAVHLTVKNAGSMRIASLNGAIFGAIAYGTYSVTNYAMLTDWTTLLLISDTLWGAILTAICSAVSFACSKPTQR